MGKSEPHEVLEAEQAQARHWMRGHVCRPGDTRAYHFATPGDSHFWFGLTWTPGHLTLVGDIGEMTLTHYSALREFESGMRWAEQGSYEYLVGKSNKQETHLDRDATIARIWEIVLEPAIEARREQIRDRREIRRFTAGQMREWQRDLDSWTPLLGTGKPVVEDYLSEPEPLEPLSCEKRFAVIKGAFCRARDHKGQELWNVPDGWEALHAAWRELGWPGHDPNEIFTHQGRAELRDELDRSLDNNASINESADLCSRLGLEDYYGEQRYCSRTIAQIEAIRKGAGMILDELRPSRTWDRVWSDPVV